MHNQPNIKIYKIDGNHLRKERSKKLKRISNRDSNKEKQLVAWQMRDSSFIYLAWYDTRASNVINCCRLLGDHMRCTRRANLKKLNRK